MSTKRQLMLSDVKEHFLSKLIHVKYNVHYEGKSYFALFFCIFLH